MNCVGFSESRQSKHEGTRSRTPLSALERRVPSEICSDDAGTSTRAGVGSRNADGGVPRGAGETLQRRSRHGHARRPQHGGGFTRDDSAVDQVRDEVGGVVMTAQQNINCGQELRDAVRFE